MKERNKDFLRRGWITFLAVNYYNFNLIIVLLVVSLFNALAYEASHFSIFLIFFTIAALGVPIIVALVILSFINYFWEWLINLK